MKVKAAGVVFAIGLVLIVLLDTFLLNPETLRAQEATAALSGIVADHTGRALPDVKVSVKNLSTGHSIEVQTDPSGQYRFLNLTPGDYEVSASADGFAALTVKATVTGEGQKVLNLTVLPAASGPQIDTPQGLPNAPSSTKTEPSLEDLGFSKSDIESNTAQQTLLDKRTHMLKIHQRMGLITTIPLIATVVTSLNAGGKSEGTATRDLHVALGSLTGDLYGITAWYAIRAPRIKGTEKRGPIRFHEAMAWIHGPGMILTPILGAMAFEQKNNGEKVHGIAQAHGPVAIVTAGAFGAALISVSMKF